MNLRILFPLHSQSEFEWTASILFGEFLGIEYRLARTDVDMVTIECSGRSIQLPDVFFAKAEKRWLSPESLPQLPLAHLDLTTCSINVPLIDLPLPVLFGQPRIEIRDEFVSFGVDVLGTVFFMLSRYEEAVLPNVDNHSRFPAIASIAYKANFLNRPIVDEYVELLWACMNHLWPNLKRKLRVKRTLVSCDVDNPYVCGVDSLKGTLRRLGGDLYRRRSLRLAMQTLVNSWHRRRGDYSRDPYFQAIDWIMLVNEQAGNRVAFYFITDHSHPTMDGCYSINEPIIRFLMRHIAERGHEIGLHTSYNSYCDPLQTTREAEILRAVMEEEGIKQDKIGGRQHYLRWKTLQTSRNWEGAGMAYDSTLSFADRPGFRCGTCHEYTMYDLAERRPLKLKERPLILMECSVISGNYMKMGYSDEALELMNSYKQICHKFGGDFTLLWHNSSMLSKNDKRFYLELIN